MTSVEVKERAVGFAEREGFSSYVGFAPPVGEVTLQLSALKDCYIDKGSPNTNYDNINLWANDAGFSGLGTYRSPISFDISSIPAGATLVSASLAMYYLSKAGSPAGKKLYLYKMTRPTWVEDEATWNVYSTGNSWTTAGGDFVSSPSPAEVTVPASFQSLAWDVQALLQDALDNSIDLHLILRIEDDLGTDGDFVGLGSRTLGIADWRPILTVVYRP